jgi:hypothetical protein
MSALWIPIVLLFAARVFRGLRPRGNAALCGVAMGLAFLSGHHNIPIYLAVLLGGFWVWYVASGAGPIARRFSYRLRAGHALIFVTVCFLVAAIQMLPAVEYGRRALRWAGTPEPQHWNDKIPYSVHAEYSLHARSIPGMAIPGLMVHANPFVGIVALWLALTAVCLGWRRRRVRLAAAVALGGLLLALGADSPVHRLAYLLVPMVEKARYPAMAVAISQAGVAALAALGLEALRRGRPAGSPGGSKPRPQARVPGGTAGPTAWLAGFGLSIFGIYGALSLMHRAPAGNPTWIVAAVGLVFWAVLRWWPRRWLAGLPGVALALFLIESSTVPLPIRLENQPDSLLKPVADEADIAEFLHRQPGWFRVQMDEDAVPVNFGDFYSIEQFGGYVASMPINIQANLGEQRAPGWFGVQFYVGKKPSNPQSVEVFQSRTGLKVYRNPGIREPLWAEHDVPCGAADHLRIVSRTPGALAIDADLGCGGRVVAGDPWFPGWRAWVDDQRVRIGEYAGVVRTVPVAAGHHRIEFRYVPGSVYWGACLSALGLLLAALVWRFDGGGHGVLPHSPDYSLVAGR